MAVLVKPGSKSPGIIISGEDVTVRVRERALEGRATEATLRALAAALRVPQSAVTLVRGAASRHKSFAITGLTPREVSERLAAPVR